MNVAGKGQLSVFGLTVPPKEEKAVKPHVSKPPDASRRGAGLPVNVSELIYDWNRLYPKSLHPPGPVRLTDETLARRPQSPSVRDPSIEQKIEILHLMEALGINTLDLGSARCRSARR